MADLVGESVGSYTITERVGRGGMADVYKALHTGLSVHRAVKVIRPEFVTADDFRARFQKEAQAVAQLRHPNIVQVHDFGTHAGAYYMVMEFIEGRDLKRILQDEGPIRPISRAVDIVVRVANALEYAHARGLIHRDIKPENVMMTPNGEPILTDFGIAKLVTSSTHLTQTGFGIGTPAYMAPEQAQGLTDVGPAADIYALTVVLFELLTGRVPFSADTPIAVIMKSLSDPLPLPRSLNADISEALQAVVIKGTQKRPEDRYATVGALRDALLEAATTAVRGPGDPTLVRRSSGKATDVATTIMAPRPSSKMLVRGSIAALVVLAAAGVGYWLTTRGQGGAPAPAPVAAAHTSPSEAAPSAAVTTNGGALVLDQTVTAHASRPGERIEYTFDAEAGDTVFFDRADGSQPTDFALIAPDGARVFDAAADEGPLELPRSGAYRLVASPRGEAAAPFEFVLRRLATPVLDAGEIKANQLIEGRTLVPGQVAQYRIALREGQTVRLALGRTSEPTDFHLIDPASTEIFAADADTAEVSVPTSGTYTLTVDPRFDRAAEFAFALRTPMPENAPRTPAAKPPRSPADLARSSPQSRVPPPALNPRTAKLLTDAGDARKAGELAVAKEALAKLDPERLSPYARSRLEHMNALIAHDEKDYVAEQKYLDAAIRAGGLNDEETAAARSQIARIEVLQEGTATTTAESTIASTPAPAASASLVTPSAATSTGNQVTKGVTTQRDLLRMFGGPNITTFNEAGLETWVYERTATQTDTTSTSQSVSGGVDFNLFFNVGNLGASASKGTSRESASARSTIRSVTVIVTFAPDRTVADYTVRESYF